MPFSGGRPGTIDATLELESRMISLVEVGGQAQHGILVGDEVLTVDGASVVNLDGNAVMRVITIRGGGNSAVLSIRRGATMRTISVLVRTSDS